MKGINGGQRLRHVDIAKAIGLIAIVWGHFLSPYLRIEVYSFHVPIFFCISGFFLNTEKPIGKYIEEKTESLLIPYVLTGVAMIVISFLKTMIFRRDFQQAGMAAWKYVKAFLYGSGLPIQNETFFVNEIGPIWFLLALFWGLLITKCTIKLRFQIIVIFMVVALGMLTTQYGWFPLSLQAGMVATGYVYLGYIARNLIQKGYIHNLTERIIGFIGIGLWCIYLATASEAVICCRNVYPQGFWDVIGTLSGVVSIIFISKYVVVYIPVLRNIFVFWGKHSLLFLCFHTIDTVLFQWHFVVDNLKCETIYIILFLFICKLALYSMLIGIWIFCRQKWVGFQITRQKKIG